MASLRLLVASFLCVFLANAQVPATATYFDVPAGTPVPGNYTGPLRPQVHFSPPSNFMNDPNGLHLDSSGTYHLYYQYNPTATVAGNQHWGHATSKDLYHWENQAIALFNYNSSSYAFSGSAIIDVNNTSGFFPGQDNGVVAIYTIDSSEPLALQTQNLAYSKDGGYSFEFYAGNPVLNIGSSQFRDPQVTRYNDHWVMAVSYASEYTIGFFTSQDLKNWTHASNVSHVGVLGQQYECPNLVELPVEGTDEMLYVLQISINPGAPLGGSISQAIVGNFDGYTFTPVDRAARINDFGKDNYAGQFFYGLPKGSPGIALGWASNWEYSQDVPTGNTEGWRSAMALPRQVSLRRIAGLDWALVSQPMDLSPVRGKLLSQKTLGNGSVLVDFSTVTSNAVYFEANITEGVAGGWLNFTFSSPVSGEYLQGGAALGPMAPLWINRGGIRGYDQVYFTDKFSGYTFQGITNVMGVIDRSLLEVFANQGQISATTSFFPERPLTLLSIASSSILPNNITISVAVYELESAWAKYENEAGTVLGNVTTASNSTSRRHKRMTYEAGW